MSDHTIERDGIKFIEPTPIKVEGVSPEMEKRISDNLNLFRHWTKPDQSVETAYKILGEKERHQNLPHSDELREALSKVAASDPNLEKTLSGILSELKEKTDKLVENTEGLVNRANYLAQEAFIDPTVGCLNKNAFYTAMKNIIEAKQKPKEQREGLEKELTTGPTSVVIIDLNNLKLFNDFGYDGCGNKAIDYAMNYIAGNLRHSKITTPQSEHQQEQDKRHHHQPLGDLVTRLGGDELAVIMPNCPKEKAKEHIGHILNEMAHESIGQTNPANNDFVRCRPGTCEARDDFGNSANIQISAAFGCHEFREGIAPDANPNKVIKAMIREASAEETKQKMQAKIDASKVPGGYPAIEDHAEARKEIKKILIAQGLVPTVPDKELSIREKIDLVGKETGRKVKPREKNPIVNYKNSSFAEQIEEKRKSSEAANARG